MRSIFTPAFWDPGRILFAKAVTALVCFFVGLSFLLSSIRSGSMVSVALMTAALGLCVYLSRMLWTTLQSESDSPQSLPPRDIDKPWTYRRDWRPDVFHEEKVRVRLRAVFGSLFMGMGAAITLSSVYGRFFETWQFHPHMILVWGGSHRGGRLFVDGAARADSPVPLRADVTAHADKAGRDGAAPERYLPHVSPTRGHP